jgi:cytoskeletal protein CcmA (bactofilin family)
MFSRSKGETPDKALKKQEKPKVPSILSEDLRISGDLKTDGDIQLDGIVDGDISTHTLTVGPNATVNGAITGETIKIAGTVNGTITGKVVELTRSARVVGDILHQSLAIEAGAHIEGMCRHVAAEPVRPSLVITDTATADEASAS